MDVARVIFYQSSFNKDNNSKFSHYLENLRLQQILYFCQVVSLRFFDQELFQDDCQAWKHGPVVPEIYQTYEYNKQNLFLTTKNIDPYVELITDITIKMIGDLEYCSHEDTGAWSKVYKPDIRHIIIPKESIRENIPQSFLHLANEFFKQSKEHDKSLITNDMEYFQHV